MLDYRYKHAFTVFGLLALVYVVTVVTLNVVVIRAKLRDSFADNECEGGDAKYAPLFVDPNVNTSAYNCWKRFDATDTTKCAGRGDNVLTSLDVSETMPTKKCLYAGTAKTPVAAEAKTPVAAEANAPSYDVVDANGDGIEDDPKS